MMQAFNNAAQETPLLREFVNAVERLDPHAVREMLARGADAAEADRLMANGYGSIIGKGMTPLGVVARYGATEVAGLLLDAGADINLKDKWGFTPLMRAAQNYSTLGVRFLIGRGASFEGKNDAGETVWDLAREYESISRMICEAAEERKRAVASGTAVATVEETAAWARALHDTAANRQEMLRSHAPKLTIKPV
jgi:ankyrin repeat protein